MALGDNNPLWRSPSHHLDLPKAHDHVHWMELFYDLIHVVMVFMLGNFLAEHHDMPGFIAFALLFIAMWLAWGETSVYNSIYVSTDWLYRLSTAAQTLTVMYMAASIPSIEPSVQDPGKGFAYLVAAYGINRLILAWMYYRACGAAQEVSSLAREQGMRFALLGIWFVASSLMPAPYCVWMAIGGVVMTQVFYFLPRLTIMRLERFVPRLGHFTERFALLLLIVNGEGFFKIVVTLSEKGIYKVGPEVLINASIGGLAVFTITWIYYDYVGNVRPREGRPSLYAYWTGHLFLMMAAVMMGVALAGEIYVGFMEPFPLYYGYFGCFGLALFLASLMLIQWSIVPTTAHRFATRKVLLFGIVMALITAAVFPSIPSIIGNLLWGIGLFSQLLIPFVRAYSTLSREELENQTKNEN